MTLVTAVLDSADSLKELNAFITIDREGALKAAKAYDKARSDEKSKSGRKPCSLLGGVPVVVKDNIHVAGLRSTSSTPALKDFRPKNDAEIVAKLRGAGAIIIAKTNMHELAFGISGYNAG